MWNLKIAKTERSLAYVNPRENDMYFYIPKKMVDEYDNVTYFNLAERDEQGSARMVTEDIETLMVDLIEHESIHIVLNDIVGTEISKRFDYSINGVCIEVWMAKLRNGSAD